MTIAPDARSGSTISTHVLDTALGAPAQGIRVVLERFISEAGETELGTSVTDQDGRVRDLLDPGISLAEGSYRLRFDTGAYFARTGGESFFPEISVAFSVGRAPQHYHVPLLLSPFGYSTYRGS